MSGCPAASSSAAPCAARRILIYGVTGSGKSTLAMRLGNLTGLPCFLVDELAWQPGWVQLPVPVQRRLFTTICARPGWILDTAYSQWSEIPLANVDLVLGLDYPRWLSFARLLHRTLMRCLRHQMICNGNIESLRRTVSRDSILRWHFITFARKRARMRAWAAADGPPVLLFRSPRQLDDWLAVTFPCPTQGLSR